ncbi:creatinine amidohydrolase [Paenibacillus sp. UNCCL117]|uniref:creatininase family protein n=1 Tax=unclassified Paenibacillus TaxID=185978 RepID=UPI00088165C3|nr:MULTISPECIES: creatininase family protein [unclassified Paenibacillus]SDC96619.1 creatinine amidohydrolase [Paenibacillus sp. cl123]SFW30345.1 creatinine amidohydrolase [Paenibacillus sp. UNCCL117]
MKGGVEFGFHGHTREQLTELAQDRYTVVVPLAATEQHGPHLSVYTDSLICDYISRHAVKRAVESGGAKLLLAPLLPFGCSGHHLAFGGTLSLSSTTYLQVLRDLGDSLILSGFRRIIFLNGHGGNEHLMHQASQDLAVAHPVSVASASYWNIARDALAAANATEVGRVPGHAGGFETSLVLALDQTMVQEERIAVEHRGQSLSSSGPAGTILCKHGELTGVDGYTDSASRASAQKGQEYLEMIVQAVSEWLSRTSAIMIGDD